MLQENPDAERIIPDVDRILLEAKLKAVPARPFKPVLHYIEGLRLLNIYTEDVSYAAKWISPALEIFFKNHSDFENKVVGLSIYYRLPCPPGEMLGYHYRYHCSWEFFYPLFRWYHNSTRRLVPAKKVLEILGVEVPHSAWKEYELQALKVLETPVFVRLP